jgi:hypothetical protein
VQLSLQLYFIISMRELGSLLPGRRGWNIAALQEELPQLESIVMLASLIVNVVSLVVWVVRFDDGRFVASVFVSPDR